MIESDGAFIPQEFKGFGLNMDLKAYLIQYMYFHIERLSFNIVRRFKEAADPLINSIP